MTDPGAAPDEQRKRAEPIAVLHVDGPAVYGDLTVSGFATERTASEVAWEFAEVLRRRWPDAVVTADIQRSTEASR